MLRRYHARTDRIEHDITRQLQQIRIAVDQNSFEASLKQMPHTLMTSIDHWVYTPLS